MPVTLEKRFFTMKINKQSIDGVSLVIIDEAEANLSNAEQFKKLVIDEVEKGEKKIVISFEYVEYVDSSFLGALVAVLKALLPLKGSLVLIAMNDDIINLFQLTRLNKVFVLADTLEDALNILNG